MYSQKPQDRYFSNKDEQYVWTKFWSNVNKGSYNVLSKIEQKIIRNIHTRLLIKDFPSLIINGANYQLIYASDNDVLLEGYNRIVIGDHGPYIEFDNDNLKYDLEVTKGQEWRLEGERMVKYHWMNPKEYPNIKVYLQMGKVKYADYEIGMYYVSPYEIYKIKELQTESNTLF